MADLFQIKRSWLEGNSSVIYDTLFCYKQPKNFFEELSKINITDNDRPVIAFTSKEKLNNKSGRNQSIAVVFEERCAEFDNKVVSRYRVWSDDWDWGYWKTREQLKAMIRLVDLKLGTPVNLYRVDSRQLDALKDGKIVPYDLLKSSQRLINVSLEDFTESLEEHRQAKEIEELPFVLDYIRRNGLGDMLDQASVS